MLRIEDDHGNTEWKDDSLGFEVYTNDYDTISVFLLLKVMKCLDNVTE